MDSQTRRILLTLIAGAVVGLVLFVALYFGGVFCAMHPRCIS